MSKKIFITVTGICTFILSSAVLFQNRSSQEAVLAGQDPLSSKREVIFFAPQLFYQSLNDPIQPSDKVIQGGIIPHHLLAGELIADFFQQVSGNRYDAMIIIGPNHDNEGDTPIITSDSEWETPLGTVVPESEIVDRLSQKEFIEKNDAIMQTEHSVTGILPYVAYYFPHTQIVPLILSSTITSAEVNELKNTLESFYESRRILIIAAVDFSHYLNSEVADKKDLQTKHALETFSLDEVWNYSNDNLDSPASIVLLLSLMQQQNATTVDIVNNTNSAKLTGIAPTEVTSYFEVLYY